jgi:signal transduction histidine kinase
MTSRLPIRVRLTAVFTVIMALALAGAGLGAVVDFGRTLDAAVNARLTARAADLAAMDAAAGLADDADTVAQRIAADGRVLSASPNAGTVGLLSRNEVAVALRRSLRLDRDHTPGIEGRARLFATAASGDAVVVVATSLTGRDAALADIRTELAVTFPLVLLIATVAAYALATAALRPVERMRAEAAAITADTPGPRLAVPPGRDEVTRLGATLNDMLGRLHTALARERDFVADASHELRTPLALLQTELELALSRPRSPAETGAALRGALDDTHRVVALAEDLLLLARTDRGNGPAPTPVALAPLLHRIADECQPTVNGRAIRVQCADQVVATADTRQLERAVANLVDNATRHGAGTIDIAAHNDGGNVVVRVRDHGAGFPPAFLPRAFDRFTRADDARTGPGTGLGLAIVAAIARHHGGTAQATNHPGGGAEVRLIVPAASRSWDPR